ncbi:MAG: TIGR03086 family metal-binding protein [Ilumatobacteraceae bacterium]
MSDVADHWRIIAHTFTERAQAVPADAWANPSPCDGWTARDIVGHLVEWVPPFLESGSGITIDGIPPVGTDPAAAWTHLNAKIQTILDADDIDERIFDHPMAGRHPLDQAIDRFILGDVLIHTWDLSRATGQDEQLDGPTVDSMLDGLAALGDVLQQSGQYSARVAVPEGADNQTRLLALTGRSA